ncbi:MAG: hypothetical protein ABEJ35_03865 [Halobacteriaceae archaeon]
MRRRDLLGSLAGLGVLAGCTSSERPGGRDPSASGTGTPGEGDSSVLTRETVGDRDGVPFPAYNKPHELAIVNGADTPRTIGIALDSDDTTTSLTERWSFPARGRVVLTVAEPATYRAAITLDGRTVGHVSIPRARFDCNDSRTTLEVGPDGKLTKRTASTLIACPGPTVTGQRFTVLDRRCANGKDEATATARDEQVIVTGRIHVPDPCHSATLRSVTYDGERDTLRIVIAQTTGEEDGVCIQCVGAVSYEATVGLDAGYPGTIVVAHDHLGRTDEVVRKAVEE